MPSVEFVLIANYQLRESTSTGYIRASNGFSDARSTFGITTPSVADTDAVAVGKPPPVRFSVVSSFSPILGYNNRLSPTFTGFTSSRFGLQPKFFTGYTSSSVAVTDAGTVFKPLSVTNTDVGYPSAT